MQNLCLNVNSTSGLHPSAVWKRRVLPRSRASRHLYDFQQRNVTMEGIGSISAGGLFGDMSRELSRVAVGCLILLLLSIMGRPLRLHRSGDMHEAYLEADDASVMRES